MGGERPQDKDAGIVPVMTASPEKKNMENTTTSDHPTEAEHDSNAETLRRRTAIPDLGKTTVFASRHDPRFCYSLYVPPDFARNEAVPPPELIVVVHDSSRAFMDYRDALAEFGRWNNVSFHSSNSTNFFKLPPPHLLFVLFSILSPLAC